MFLNTPKNPTKLKEIIYLIASTFLGMLLSFIIWMFVEVGYLKWAEFRGLKVTFYNGCALHPLFQYTFLIIGIAGGFILGRFWWRYVYTDRPWEKKR